jgi:uncharacterized repeat protein (TIGR03843 family)
MIDVTESILNGNLLVVGRLVDASNATLLANIEGSEPSIEVIYKPVAGERPLWDFPDGNLANREYSAYLLSNLAEFNIVPFTVLREGPFGFGMVQEWIKVDQNIDVVEFGQSFDHQLRKLALFDAIINNTDRKFGHLLVDENGVLKGCDHGVAFHSEDKLRTVLWQFSDMPFSPEEFALLKNVKSIDLNKVFSRYLTEEEIDAISRRTDNLISSAKFPEPSETWPAVPWPPV